MQNVILIEQIFMGLDNSVFGYSNFKQLLEEIDFIC